MTKEDDRYEDDYSPQEAQVMRLQDEWARCRPPVPGGGEAPLGPGDLPPQRIMQPTGIDEVVRVDLSWHGRPSEGQS